MEHMVPIGRFSKMTRLSIKALRHYDEIGLLPPAEVDPSSGYRYYRLTQANEAEAIRTLRELDMPLDEIAAVLRADDAELVAKTLDGHRQRLTASLDEQQRRLAFIIRLINREDPIVPYAVSTKEVEPQPVASLTRHTTFAQIGTTIEQGFGELFGAVMGSGAQPAGMPFIVFHDVIDDDTDGRVEMCMPLADASIDSSALAGEVVATTLDGGLMATVTHRGPYDEIAPAYHVLTGWIHEHGHEQAGPPRELYLNDPSQVDVADQLTEVQWPIA